MLSFSTLVLWLHVSAIVIWVGGIFAVSFVFIPVIRSGVSSEEDAARIGAMATGRFQRISRELIFLIVVTGIFNLISAGNARSFSFSPTYITMLVTKVTLFVAIVVMQAWQGLWLAPALIAASGTDAAEGIRRRALVSSIASCVLGLSIILLGLSLRYR